MAISIKFTKFDNTPWGFRLAGGSDFPQPLTVIKVLEGSLAECMGLQVGDVVVRLNDEPISSLTHGQAHEALIRAGNNFALGVQREADSLRAVEQISEENIVPYKIPLAELPPVFPEEILKEETVIEQYEEETIVRSCEEEKPEIEELPDKPRDADSEIVPNQNLTDDEIAQLILEEEELLTDQGVLGVNFKKLKPRVPILKESKVLEELQHIATADPAPIEQLKRASVFLQKPQRPVPQPRKQEPEQPEVETYRVVIRKQQRRSVTDRLLERGLLKPSGQKTPEPPTPEVKMSETHDGAPSVDSSASPSDGTTREGATSALSPSQSCAADLSDDVLTKSPESADPRVRVDRGVIEIRLEVDHVERGMNRGVEGVESGGEAVADVKVSEANVGVEEAGDPGCKVGRVVDGMNRAKDENLRVYEVVDEVNKENVDEKEASDDISEVNEENVEMREENDLALRANEVNVEVNEVKGLAFKVSRVDDELPRRGSSRRRRSRFYTRPHYFRRCLLGRRGPTEPNRTSKQGLSSRAGVLPNNAEETASRTLNSELNGHETMCGKTKTRKDFEIREKMEDTLLKRFFSAFASDEHARSSKTSDVASARKSVSLWRTRYAEKIFDRSVGFVVACLRSIFLRHFVENPPLDLAEEQYVARIELPLAVKTLLGSLGDEGSNSRGRKARLYFKGRYFQHVLRRNVARVLSCAKDALHAGDTEKRARCRRSIRMKAHYVERCLENPNFSMAGNLVDFLDRVLRDIQEFYRSFSERKWHSKRTYSFRTRYFERILKRHVRALCFFVESVRSQILRAVDHPSCLSQNATISEADEQNSVEESPDDSVPNISANDADAFGSFLRSSGDYVSTEVFHRGSRRLSRSLKVSCSSVSGTSSWLEKLRNVTFDYSSWFPPRFAKESDASVLTKVLRSSGDFVSTEVFHRGSRRLSRSSRRSSASIEAPSWSEAFRNASFDCSGWLPLRAANEDVEQGVCDEKSLKDAEREGRRLSFVPTVLYEGLTNRIGVDFTRLVAYAFVPCTSIILLYMYK